MYDGGICHISLVLVYIALYNQTERCLFLSTLFLCVKTLQIPAGHGRKMQGYHFVRSTGDRRYIAIIKEKNHNAVPGKKHANPSLTESES